MKARRPGGKAVANRVAAGLGGGYLLAASAAFGLAGILPGSRIEAVAAAQISAFVVFVLAALWSFVPQRGSTVWTVILTAAGAFVALGMMSSSA